MSKIDLLNQLVADLSIAFVKFHNLHWNVIGEPGERFKEVHEYAEELYDMLNENYDEVAERVKMLGEFPPASAKAYLERTKIEELENRDYTIHETYEHLRDTLEYLRGLIADARNKADEDDDFATVAMLEDIVQDYDKHIWFIKQALK